MGKISVYHQQKLESSLVGTPGVDNSGTILANSARQENQQAQSTQLQVQGAQYGQMEQELRNTSYQAQHQVNQLIAEHAQLEAHSKALADKGMALTAYNELLRSAEDTRQQKANGWGKDYTGYPKALDDDVSTLTDAIGTDKYALNPEAHAIYLEKATGLRDTMYQQSVSHAISMNANLAQSGAKNVIDNFASEGSNAGSLQELFERSLIPMGNAAIDGKDILGAPIMDAYHKQKQTEAVQNWIGANRVQNPAMVLNALDSGRLNHILDGKEQGAARSQLISQEHANLQAALAQQQLGVSAQEAAGHKAYGAALSDPSPTNLQKSITYFSDEVNRLGKDPNADKHLLAFANTKLAESVALRDRVEARTRAIEADKVQFAQLGLSGAQAQQKALEIEISTWNKQVVNKQSTPEGITAIQNFNTAMGVLGKTSQALRGTPVEIQYINNARAAAVAAAPYMIKLNDANTQWKHSWSLIETTLQRIRNGQVNVDKNNPVAPDTAASARDEAEKYLRLMTTPASDIIHKSLNPAGDPHIENIINGSIQKELAAQVGHWEQQLGDTIKSQQVQGLRTNVERATLQKPSSIVPPAPNSPAKGFIPAAPVVPTVGNYGYGVAGALQYYSANKSPTLREQFKSKYGKYPEEMTGGR